MMKLLSKEKGFTIIEAIMAQVVLLIGAVAILGAFIAASRMNAESEDRTVAANIARLKIEEIMDTEFGFVLNPFDPGGEPVPKPVVIHPADEYPFSGEPQPQSPGEESPFWTRNPRGGWDTSLWRGTYTISYPDYPAIADPLRTRVTISWRDQNDRPRSLRMETLISVIPGRFRS